VMAGRGIRRADCPQIDAAIARLEGLVASAIIAEALQLLNERASEPGSAPLCQVNAVER
jgi:hypothetical protein